MTAKLTAAADGLSGSLAVGANEAFQFKPVAGGLELSQDGITFQTVDTDGKVAFPAQGQSLVSDGYVKLPGGLIIQWGKTTNDNSIGTGVASANFPIAFPITCFHVVLQTNSSGATPPARGASLMGVSASGFSWANYNEANALSANADSVDYIAIGY